VNINWLQQVQWDFFVSF